jgi:hypothetical protein
MFVAFPTALQQRKPGRQTISMLPALLFSLLFLPLAWWLRRRGMGKWAIAPLLTSVILLGFTIAIKIDDLSHRQATADLEVLLAELDRSDLMVSTDLSNPDDFLFLASTGSQALNRALAYAPEHRQRIDSVLFALAAWVASPGNLRQWRRGANWDREVFFLAHAGATLGHYQLATRDLTFEDAFKSIGEHLGRRLERGRYKHLLSRPDEDFYRPADNAAALYTLSLYDEFYGTDFTLSNFRDWSRYLADELYYVESRLPCAAFSETNRCHLEPNATATGLYIAYRAAARPAEVTDDVPWREWLHYFGTSSMSPFSLGIRPGMRDGREARYCDAAAYPAHCDHYEEAVGLWAAAEYGGSYTYYRLYATNALRRWFFADTNYGAMRPTARVQGLTRVAIRGIAEGT